MKQYTVICEGRSEFVYIQRLQSFLDSQFAGWSVPLTFRPIDNGGGSCGTVITGYKKQRAENKRAIIQVWVDYDLYFRNDKDCMTRYLAKPRGIPDFRFSYHNFEDSLLRLKQNLQAPIITPSSDPHCGDFASFLIEQIDEGFPTLLR